MERETGLEPATACLEGRNSTTELLPLNIIYRGNFKPAISICKALGKGGFEPPRLAAHDPKSCSSASSDTSPHSDIKVYD